MNSQARSILVLLVLGLAAAMVPLSASAAGACASDCSGQTALRCAVEGLAEGEWCAFDSTDPSLPAATHQMSHDALETCSNCCPDWTWTYTDSLAWWPGPSPGFGHILFEGSPHSGPSSVMRYDEATNSWSRGSGTFSCGPQSCSNGNLSSPSMFSSGCSAARHGYDENAIEPSSGKLYRLYPRSGGSGFRIYNRDTDSWSGLSAAPDGNDWANFGVATKFFPEWNVGGANGAFIVVARNGVMQAFDPQGDSWTGNLGGVSFDKGLHFAMEYDSTHGVMWLMDGEGQGAGKKHYRLDPDGGLTQLQSLDGSGKPSGFGVTSLVVGHDSGSGTFIVWDCDGGGVWYSYDIMLDRWARIDRSMPPLTRTQGCSTGNVAEVSIRNYAVNGFLVAESDSRRTLYLYRHSNADLDFSAPMPPGELSIDGQ